MSLAPLCLWEIISLCNIHKKKLKVVRPSYLDYLFATINL